MASRLPKQGQQFNEPLEANVKNTKQLAPLFAAAVAMTALVGASAFADSRPADGTRGRGDGRGAIRRERGSDGASARRGNDSSNAARPAQSSVEVRGERGNRGDGGRITRERDQAEAPRTSESRSYESRSSDRNRGNGTYDRNRGSNDRNRGSGTYDRNRGSNDRNRGNNNGGDWRNSSRSGSSRGTYNRGGSGRYDNRQRYQHSGRVSRYNRYGDGYRVWIVGAPYPYYIPLAYWSPSRFRIGVSINLGGYYNPLGYYDYYDPYYDNGGYYDNRASSRGELRGVVESVDYRRDTFVVRNEASGSFVTVLLRDRNDRDVRPGDYVELSGDWTRSGVFQAYDLDVLDYDARRR
jgi:hypothetical protein